MTLTRKRKNNTAIHEFYKIEVEDWEAYYHFGIAPKNIVEGLYWEISKLIVIGKLTSPILNAANKARIEIRGDQQLDDHWQPKPTIISAKAIGWMEIPRADNTLIFYCSIPYHSLPYLVCAAHAGKIKHILIWGTKLRYRQGTVSSLSLSSQEDEV